MYKEFAAGCLVLFILFLICKQAKKKSPRTLQTIIWGVLGLCVVLQVIYNCAVMFPDFYMDTVGGKLRFATFSENLLAYNDGWDFCDEILQPILKNRTVKLDDTAPYYRTYFDLLSKECEFESFDASTRNAVFASDGDFDFVTSFETFRIMDYVKDPDALPDILKAKLENETPPDVRIHMASVQEEDALVCLVAPDTSLYLLGEKQLSAYTDQANGGADHAN